MSPSESEMLMTRLIFLMALFLVAASVSAQDWQYQFQDRPSPEANVVVVFHQVREGSQRESRISGRVFNRGLKAARNVRVICELRRSGVVVSTTEASTIPENVPPTSFADFDARIPIYFDPRDHTVHVRTEWSQN